MNTFLQILSIIAFSIVVLVVYNVLKAYVLYKIKINKWIILTAALVIFIVPMALWKNIPIYMSRYIIPGLFVMLFLWFMDLSGFLGKRKTTNTNYTTSSSKKNKKPDVIIRPKAKPNRVKNMKK
ncbi:MAG TPA: hypothetical protein VIM70_22390 [Clostridium sp.]|uniref:hypothetical protein n=1 Tax=Clostridium sp. TaxID=1506 RepID=UPI002F93DEA3